ncbi:MAG: UDP-galactopyranose mutase [Acidobacteriaceae bacterium]|nr:UDP-galactopyranose mutase [Acidobacteriaceae bacterium]
MKVDWMVVGAGFTGAVLAERLASQLDQKVLIVDSRPHIGGNAYDCRDEHGMLIHKYGPHIFHTNSLAVWNYLSQFTEWRFYYHRTLAAVEGKKVPLPFNLNSLHALFPVSYAERLEHLLVQHFGLGRRIPLVKLRQSPSEDIQALSGYIYEHIFLHYTRKQWDLEPEDLEPSVLARVPISVSRDDRYFPDIYQAMPSQGYTQLLRRMLAHRNIHILLNTELRDMAEGGVQYGRMIYTGPIDSFFSYCYGPLPYRSARFDFQHLQQTYYQGAAIVNYPNGVPFTRISEFKYLTGQKAPGTTVAFEYPEPYHPGENLPLYPIPHPANHELYSRYLELAKALDGRFLFAGRLADYKYYNMDQAVARALKVFHGIAQSQRPSKTRIK